MISRLQIQGVSPCLGRPKDRSSDFTKNRVDVICSGRFFIWTIGFTLWYNMEKYGQRERDRLHGATR